MTIEEKKQAINKYCSCKENCTYEEEYPCPLYPFDCDHIDESNVDGYFKLVSAMPDYTGQKETEEVPNDNVNHPSHYTQGGMECIDEMIILFGKEAVKHFCLCNAWKYRYRQSEKNGEEDLKKSDWYIKKYKELCEMGDTNG